MQRKIIPGVIDGQQALSCLSPEASAHDAALTMRERQVGAILIVEHGRLVGIVTERDLAYRLVAEGRDPNATVLREIMTPDPDTVAPDDKALDAFDKMRRGRYRHLPVLCGSELCGMVSIRDLYEAVRQMLEEELHDAETLIRGDQYGIATV